MDLWLQREAARSAPFPPPSWLLCCCACSHVRAHARTHPRVCNVCTLPTLLACGIAWVQNPAGGVHVPDLNVIPVSTVEDVVRTMAKGYKNRAVGSHNVNEHSSRSHLVLSVDVSGQGCKCPRPRSPHCAVPRGVLVQLSAVLAARMTTCAVVGCVPL